MKQDLSRDEAIRQAIDWAIGHDILEEFLKNNGTEVRNMLFEEYNVETALKVREEEAQFNTQTSITLNLLRKGFAAEDVADSTGLPLPQVLGLRESKI